MTTRAGDSPLSHRHRQTLQRAFERLEGQSFAAQLAELAGKPLDRMLKMMPTAANVGLSRAIEVAIWRCLNLAINSIDTRSRHPPSTSMSSFLAAVNGGLSGFFGLAALPIELPATTTLILRAIADVARHRGEDLLELEPRLACLEVFALGSGKSVRRMDVGYYASRAVLGKLAANASFCLAERSAAGASAPVVNSFVSEIASRFGVVVSERFAAGAIPLLGAIGGATINLMFMNHFQRVAQGHFTIRRLERVYGQTAVRREYELLLRRQPSERMDVLYRRRKPHFSTSRPYDELSPAFTHLSQILR